MSNIRNIFLRNYLLLILFAIVLINAISSLISPIDNSLYLGNGGLVDYGPQFS